MKLIGIDLDGTLLTSKNEISEKNLQALKYIANKEDYYVYICSGRPVENIKDILEKYDLPITRVGSNGGIAFEGDKLLFEYVFDKEAADTVYQVVKDYPFLTYNRNGRFGSKNHIEELEKLFKNAEGEYTEEEYHSFTRYRDNLVYQNIDDFTKFQEDEEHKIFKFFLYTPIMSIKEKIQDQLKDKKGINCTESERTNLEILPDNVDKGKVFEHLEEILGLKDSVRIAIGDSLNDYEMFKMADYGFAMENAHPEIKKIATHVVAHHNEDGVAEAIEIIKNL